MREGGGGIMKGVCIDGRRDASEEGRPMGTQYVSTTHPIIVRGTQNECDYDYKPVHRVKKKNREREKRKKKKRRENEVRKITYIQT